MIFLFPCFWGDGQANGISGLTYSLLAHRDREQELPEEVRAAIEEHKDEIHSEEDVRRMAENLMLRR